MVQFCVRAVIGAARLPYQQAIENERELFLTLRESGQSQAMRYAFFAERQIARVSATVVVLIVLFFSLFEAKLYRRL